MSNSISSTEMPEPCAATDGDGITCALSAGHSGPHAVSVWDFSGVGLYRQTWNDYRVNCSYVTTPSRGAS